MKQSHEGRRKVVEVQHEPKWWQPGAQFEFLHRELASEAEDAGHGEKVVDEVDEEKFAEDGSGDQARRLDHQPYAGHFDEEEDCIGVADSKNERQLRVPTVHGLRGVAHEADDHVSDCNYLQHHLDEQKLLLLPHDFEAEEVEAQDEVGEVD